MRKLTLRQRSAVYLTDDEAVRIFEENYERTKDACWLRFANIVKRPYNTDKTNATVELFEKSDRYVGLLLYASAGSETALKIMEKEYGLRDGDMLIPDHGDPLLSAFQVAWDKEYGTVISMELKNPQQRAGIWWEQSSILKKLGVTQNVEIPELTTIREEVRQLK